MNSKGYAVAQVRDGPAGHIVEHVLCVYRTREEAEARLEAERAASPEAERQLSILDVA